MCRFECSNDAAPDACVESKPFGFAIASPGYIRLARCREANACSGELPSVEAGRDGMRRGDLTVHVSWSTDIAPEKNAHARRRFFPRKPSQRVC
jgi:hypothetical protein